MSGVSCELLITALLCRHRFPLIFLLLKNRNPVSAVVCLIEHLRQKTPHDKKIKHNRRPYGMQIYSSDDVHIIFFLEKLFPAIHPY